MKTEVLLSKRIKGFKSTLRHTEIKNVTNTGQFGIVFENSLREMKSHADYRDSIVLKKLCFQNVYVVHIHILLSFGVEVKLEHAPD